MLRRAGLILAAVFLASTGRTAPPNPGSGDDSANAIPAATQSMDTIRPSIRIVHTDNPPVIDGQLDDPAWEHAALLTRLIQVEPVPGQEPSEKTEIRLLYDRDFLYLGYRCYDQEPNAILAREMVRDVPLTTDDRISLVFDTYHDLQNGYLFSVNPAGTKWDALIEPGELFRDEWNAIWYAKARIDEQGWTAEVAIPFKSVSFDPNKTTWGFNIMRAVRRGNEIVRWASPSPDFTFINLGAAGTIEGLAGIEQGLGLDVKPLFAATYRTDRRNSDTDRIGQPSLDAFYRVTPGVTASLTVNTDFSEAPVDERQINLGRFDLFFPETRDFFLQDAGIFEFSGIEENGRPFFSRTIGIRQSGDPKPIDLHAGAKVTGRAGRWGIGLLDVQQAEYEDVSSQNLGVARFTYDIFEESFIGAIATHGNPASNDDNAVVGMDLRLRNSRFRGDRVLTADAYVLRSFSENLSGDESSFAARVQYPNDLVNWSLSYQLLDDNYNPALGFLNRVGIQRVDGRFRYRVRPENWLRTVDSEATFLTVWDTDGKVESVGFTWDILKLENQVEDILTLTYKRTREDLVDPFEISDGVIIPPTSYTWDRIGATLETTKARAVSLVLSVEWGGFYSDSRFDSKATLEWRPSRHLFVSLEYEQNDVRLDEGNFTTRLAVLRVDAAFTPDLSWTSLAQYDNVSDTLGIQSRIRWIVEPGDEIWLIFNQGYEASHRRVRSILSDVTLKVGYTLRF
jgi:hypothetical protein